MLTWKQVCGKLFLTKVMLCISRLSRRQYVRLERCFFTQKRAITGRYLEMIIAVTNSTHAFSRRSMTCKIWLIRFTTHSFLVKTILSAISVVYAHNYQKDKYLQYNDSNCFYVGKLTTDHCSLKVNLYLRFEISKMFYKHLDHGVHRVPAERLAWLKVAVMFNVHNLIEIKQCLWAIKNDCHKQMLALRR